MSYQEGIKLIDLGLCPTHYNNCMFCEFGHLTECHHPMNCEEAQCSHYQDDMNEV